VPKRLQEYQENESALMVEEAEINQTVNLFGCKSSTIVVKGKVNAVTLSTTASASIRERALWLRVPPFSQLHKDIGPCGVRHIVHFDHKLAIVRSTNNWCSANNPTRLDGLWANLLE